MSLLPTQITENRLPVYNSDDLVLELEWGAQDCALHIRHINMKPSVVKFLISYVPKIVDFLWYMGYERLWTAVHQDNKTIQRLVTLTGASAVAIHEDHIYYYKEPEWLTH